MAQRRAPPIGIDLGTAYTRVAVRDGTQCRMIPDQNGNSAMPSYVTFTNTGLLVGDAARAQALHNPDNTIFDVIRLIGRCYSHPSVQNDMRLWPFKVTASPDEKLQVEVNWNGRLWKFNAVEICAMLLIQIKKNAENNLRTTVTDAVITVPVCFNYEQRLAIKQAGIIANLNFMQILSAPAASAFFYGMMRAPKSTHTISSIARSLFQPAPEEHNMFIFDLGAGTLDVAVVTIKEDECRVRAASGDGHLGGSDFDNNLTEYFVSEWKKRGREDIKSIPMAICNLRTLCENAKISLSSGELMVPMKVTPFYDDVYFESSITVAKFDELNNELFLKCIRIMERCLVDSRIHIDAVHEIILAGSSARIPLVKNYVERYFRSTNLPFSKHLETATAYGAAFQAFILSRRWNGKAQCLFLHDTTPFSLGLQSLEGRMNVIVPRNMNIPVSIEKTFRFNKKPYFLQVYEGEGELTRENNFLGKLELPGSQISSNWCNIKVSFEINENGILTVAAQELPVGTRKIITFTCNKVEESQKRVWEAFLYKESGKGVNKASTTKIVTRSGSSRNWDKVRDTTLLAKPMSMGNDKSSKIRAGQSSRQYVDPEQYAIGIDFGTTYSSVAVWQRNSAKIIENEYGSRLTSSVVAFTDTGRLIGDTFHKEQITANPANTISNIKRLIGRFYSDQQVQNDRNKSMISVQYKNEKKSFAPEEIAAMVLSKMKEIAEAHLNSTVTKAVISVPASFSDSQRKAIKDAGVIAGLNVMQLLNEPMAAAIAYFLQKNSVENSREKILLIFDLGGGNLDVSIVTIKDGSIRVQAVAGDTSLGGEDFDNNMVSYFVEKFKKEKKRDISNKPRSLRRLRAACEKSKRILSTNAQTVVEIDALDEGIDFRSVMTRKIFEEINEGAFKRCISCVERCLEDAEMGRGSIDEVVLIGGSTRIPKMQQVLLEFFNGKELCKSMNADEAVAYGAAVQAAILSGNEDRENFNILELQDVTSMSFGLENKDGATTSLLFPKHTPIPATKELIFTNCSDGLPGFSIEVQECELASTMAFTLSGITPKPRVQSRVKISFEVDDSGFLNLRAKDMGAIEKNEIDVIKENRGLRTEEIYKMVEAAAGYKAEDEKHRARAAALNSLENSAYKLKAIARQAGLAASDQKSVEEADKAITWLETNQHAAIDEICAWKKKLEMIENKVRFTALDSLGIMAKQTKAITSDLAISASDPILEHTADASLAWLEKNQHARIDEINAWKKKLQTIQTQLRSAVINYLRNMACKIKEIASNPTYSALQNLQYKKTMEVAENTIVWLATNDQAGFDEIINCKRNLETIKSQVTLMGVQDEQDRDVQ